MVSIAAFQAVDPGSIPGQRTRSFTLCYIISFLSLTRCRHLLMNQSYLDILTLTKQILANISVIKASTESPNFYNLSSCIEVFRHILL